MDIEEKIDAFLDGAPHAVIGASRDRSKYGNKVLRCYRQKGRPVYPVNPNAEEVEGLTSYPNVAALPEEVHGVSIITPPEVTEKVVDELAAAGIGHAWMQPGAESAKAVASCEGAGINVIADGSCILVMLGYRE